MSHPAQVPLFPNGEEAPLGAQWKKLGLDVYVWGIYDWNDNNNKNDQE